jgi:hypothetical protein
MALTFRERLSPPDTTASTADRCGAAISDQAADASTCPSLAAEVTYAAGRRLDSRPPTTRAVAEGRRHNVRGRSVGARLEPARAAQTRPTPACAVPRDASIPSWVGVERFRHASGVVIPELVGHDLVQMMWIRGFTVSPCNSISPIWCSTALRSSGCSAKISGRRASTPLPQPWQDCASLERPSMGFFTDWERFLPKSAVVEPHPAALSSSASSLFPLAETRAPPRPQRSTWRLCFGLVEPGKIILDVRLSDRHLG